MLVKLVLYAPTTAYYGIIRRKNNARVENYTGEI